MKKVNHWLTWFFFRKEFNIFVPMIHTLCTQRCWKSLLGLLFLLLSLSGFAIELQDQHHHYSYSFQDTDEVEEESSEEDKSVWNLDILNDAIELPYSSIARFLQTFGLHQTSYAQQGPISGRLRCILFHQLKYDSCS